MKKNKMMRLASFLLVAVMLTTCAISGTFAKYVTSTTASDSARVAKWGVVLATDTNLFGTDYVAADSNIIGSANLTVSSAGETNRADVVAPGTKGSMNFSIIGTPEVKVDVDITLSNQNALSMIKVPGKTNDNYTDYTVYPNSTFEQKTDYYPIKWTLKRAATGDGSKSVVVNGTGESAVTLQNVNLAAIEAYFASKSSSDYAANTDLANEFGYYELSWEWAFTDNDKADTLLGQVAAGILTDSTIITTESFNFKISVTQVD